jgi:hypothetical protein
VIEPFVRVVHTREEAHQAASDAYALAKLLLADGKRPRFELAHDDDPLSLKQQRFFHGPVLRQIAQQARVNGVGYPPEIWKELFRTLFLEPTWVQVGERTIEVRKSTQELGARAYSDLIDRVIAHAATELGVEFRFRADEREAVRYRPTRATTKEEATC